MKTAEQGAAAPALGPDAESSRDVFVARQPIFDRRRRVYGYELLFRTSLADLCPPTDGTEAIRHVMEVAWLSLGMKTLVGDKRVFVNFTRDLLLAGFEAAIPPKRTVVEILESVEPDDDVIWACKRLKQNGYRLALDDFIYRPALDPLIEMADLIKVGFGECDPEEQCRHVRRVVPNAALLAEKVETQEEGMSQ